MSTLHRTLSSISSSNTPWSFFRGRSPGFARWLADQSVALRLAGESKPGVARPALSERPIWRPHLGLWEGRAEPALSEAKGRPRSQADLPIAHRRSRWDGNLAIVDIRPSKSANRANPPIFQLLDGFPAEHVICFQ